MLLVQKHAYGQHCKVGKLSFTFCHSVYFHILKMYIAFRPQKEVGLKKKAPQLERFMTFATSNQKMEFFACKWVHPASGNNAQLSTYTEQIEPWLMVM